MYIIYNAQRMAVFDDYELIENSHLIHYFCDTITFSTDEISFWKDAKMNKIIISQASNQYIEIYINETPLRTGEVIVSHNDLIEVRNNGSFYILYMNNEAYQCSCITLKDSIIIGRSSSSDIIFEHPAVSRQHAQITFSNHSAFIKKMSLNGYLFINAYEYDEKELRFGDTICVLGGQIIYLGDYIIVYGEHKISSTCNAVQFSEINTDEVHHWLYSSAPRILRSVEKSRIVIDPPTQLNPLKPVPFILSVGPSLTMALAMLVSTGVSLSNILIEGINAGVITSAVMAVSMLAGAVMWPGLLRRHNRKQEVANILKREERYKEYLTEKDAEIQKIYNKNLKIRAENLLPEVGKLSSVFEGNVLPMYLWERNPQDNDYLYIRLGCGTILSDIEIQTAEKRFTIEKDDLLDLSREVAERYKYYDDSPIGISLTDNHIIGLFGTNEDKQTLVNAILAGICLLHSSSSVKIAFLASDAHELERYRYIHDIPHIWDNEKRIRYLANDVFSAQSVLTEIFKNLCIPHSGSKQKILSHYVIFTYLTEEVEKSALYQTVCGQPEMYPVTFIFISEQYGALPHECQAIVQGLENSCGIYVKNSNNNRFVPFVTDNFKEVTLYNTLSDLSKIEIQHDSITSEVPDRIGFLDMFRVGNIAALKISYRWRNSKPYQSLATPIGIIADNEVLYFDIHEAFHGCHGIVAGTTGSGKSEFIQAYILSMMINYSPDDVNFMLVDFKGGDIAIPFDGIPHVSAVVSNLTKTMLYRAIVSLQAEKNKRQILFAETARKLGMDKIDINSYQKLYKNGQVTVAVPHLIIIMDEFAQFKTQHSEYMQDLIDIAQIGRSLGIHLILATQKPAGVVDGQIWSNSRFKFCLKVLEREDSKAVLQRDEAAYITNPGRGYMQVGYNEIFNQFQSGYCRAKYIPSETYCDIEDLTVSMIDVTGKHIMEETDIDDSLKASAPTQINALTEAIRQCSVNMNFKVHPLWLPPLENYIYTDECSVSYGKEDALLVGLMDIPSKQKQIWYAHNFIINGSIAVYGASGSGKTTLIQSILFQGISQFSPKQFKYAVIDMSGRNYSVFADTSYSFGVASASESDHFSDIFDELEEELAYRKEKFAEVGCNSYSEYKENCREELPMIVIVLENYAKFREAEYQYEERLINLLNGGQAFGLYFIVTTNSKSGIYYKVREQLSTTIVFRMIEADVYRDLLGTVVPVEPEAIKGRALIVYDGEAIEMQVALAIHNASETERNRIMKEQLNRVYNKSANIPKTEPVTVIEKKDTPDNGSISQRQSAGDETYYTSVPERNGVIYLGNDVLSHNKIFVDPQVDNKYFICSMEDFDIQALCRSMLSKFDEYNTYILRGNEEDIYKTVLSQLDFCIDRGVTPVLVIPDFVRLYSDISNEGLDVLNKYINRHKEDIIYITCSVLKNFVDYNGTDLQVYLCRQASVTIIVGGSLDDKNATVLNQQIMNKISKQTREKKLKQNQMLSVVKDQYVITYIREAR